MNQTELKSRHSLRVEIEKLDGGYISNITGKRRIYRDAVDIEEAIDIRTVLNKVEDSEYILSIGLVPKEEYVCTVRGEDMITSNKILEMAKDPQLEDEGLSVYEKAKRDGTIQPADVFNPEPIKPVVDPNKPIVVDMNTCYTIDQLSNINWSEYDKVVKLSMHEKADISGIVYSTMYNAWNKIVAGTFQWQSVSTRIGMTILAQYYEKIIDKKKRKDDGVPPRNDKRLMEVVTEIELLCKGGLIKPNVLLKKVEQFKKLLIQD